MCPAEGRSLGAPATLRTRCPGAFLQRVTLRAHGWAAAVVLRLLPCSLHSAAWAHPSQASSLKPRFSGPWRTAAAAHCPHGRSLQAHCLTGCAPSSTLHPPQLWRCSPTHRSTCTPGSQLTPLLSSVGLHPGHVSPSPPDISSPRRVPCHMDSPRPQPPSGPQSPSFLGALSLCLLFTDQCCPMNPCFS